MDKNLLFSIESFPPLPESVKKINEICQVDEIDLKSVIKVIESDPILYTDILRFSNVAHHGFRHPITSISQAIALFGIAAVRGMSLTAALKSHPHTDVSPYGVTIHDWFGVMERQQRFLDLWLGKRNRALIQSLGGLTFILEIGRLVASYALMLADKSYSFQEHEAEKLSLEEKNILGNSGDELAAKLFEFWNFDPLFINSLEFSISPEEGLESKTCAALKCARTLFTLKETQPFSVVESLLSQYGFDVNDAKTAYEMMMEEAEAL